MHPAPGPPVPAADLDDTLVWTSDAQRVGEAAAARAGRRGLEGVGADSDEAVVTAFKASFKATPWDPEGKVEVTEWRAGLWGAAQASAGRARDSERELGMQAAFDTERMAAFKWIPGVPALLADLRARGLALGIITNGHPDVQRAKLAACSAAELFREEEILVGGEEPEPKPAASIFRKACERVQCSEGEALMVGDSLACDILGGHNAELAGTVWVDRHSRGLPADFSGKPPAHTVASVLELPLVLLGSYELP